MTTEKKKFANHVKNASAPLRYDSRCMGARWGGRGSDFQKSRSREPPYPIRVSTVVGTWIHILSHTPYGEMYLYGSDLDAGPPCGLTAVANEYSRQSCCNYGSMSHGE